MSFLTELFKASNKTNTINEAVTNFSSLDPVLDLFAMGGALRQRPEEAIRLFKLAYNDNPLLALKCLFYLRDIRGGQGERKIFRLCIKEVPKEVLVKNLKYIPHFGRFDDLLALDNSLIIDFISKQLNEDENNMAKGEKVSLLAKWLPSENTSSKITKKRALQLAKDLGLKPINYRKKIVALRKYISLLEQKMSARQWLEVDYENIPSQALRKHIRAFKKNDKERFEKYMEAVSKGEKKIKTDTLYTYEVFDLIGQGHGDVADIIWEKLPDYTNGSNAIVVADVSGSMNGRPMSVSVSLALYFAERNKGIFKDHFISFSNHPRLHKVQGKNLTEKFASIQNTEWGMSTNVEAVFKAILNAAINSSAQVDDVPKVVYIISDMEFNACMTNSQISNFENAKNMFENAGYKLPHIVFWNVNSLSTQLPVTMYDDAVTLISGSSQNTFRYAVEGKKPLEVMNEILNSEKYSMLKI
jgi:hypothetical protein